MATVIKKGDKQIVLLNPAERAKRYARELANGTKHDGTPLTEAEAGFRMGVLNERKTQAKIYNKQNGLESKARKRGRKANRGGNLPVIY